MAPESALNPIPAWRCEYWGSCVAAVKNPQAVCPSCDNGNCEAFIAKTGRPRNVPCDARPVVVVNAAALVKFAELAKMAADFAPGCSGEDTNEGFIADCDDLIAAGKDAE